MHTVLLLNIAATLLAGEPWKADPELVESLSKRRAGINYKEEAVPQYKLPALLKCEDGTVVSDVKTWETKRRPEIFRLLEAEMFGKCPEKIDAVEFKVENTDPKAMDGAATLKQVAITLRQGDQSLTFHLTVFVPNQASKPVPAFLLICNRDPSNIDPTRKQKSGFWPAEEIVARGYAAAAFYNGEIDPDKHDEFKNGVHGLFNPKGDPHPDDAWGTLAAWGWGASRCLDYLETDPAVDAKRVAVVGHSRGGKTALWCGARDTRFAMAVSNDSGCGGAALSRRRYGETLEVINRAFPHWFCGNFKKYSGNEDKLPFDQHMLVALMAPRVVYVASATQDLWADPRGEYLSLAHASEAYRLYGFSGIPLDPMPAADQPVTADRMGYHIRAGEHNLTPYDWQRYMDFADKVFK